MKIEIFENKYHPVIKIDDKVLDRVTSIKTEMAVGCVPYVTVKLLSGELSFSSTQSDLILQVGDRKFRVMEVEK